MEVSNTNASLMSIIGINTLKKAMNISENIMSELTQGLENASLSTQELSSQRSTSELNLLDIYA